MRHLLKICVILTSLQILAPGISLAQSVEPTYPISPIDRYKYSNVPGKIQELADFGDTWSPDTGEVTISQTDISIPGNSALPVELGRIRERDLVSAVTRKHPLGDWDVRVPRIEFDFVDGTPTTSPFLRDSRCGGIGGGWPAYAVLQRTNGTGAIIYLSTVMPNISIVDFKGAKQIMLTAGDSGWAGGAPPTRTTKNFWYITCIGNGGFLARSPDGIEYQFDVELTRQTGRIFGPTIVNRGLRVQIFPSIVRDAHGNWVRFDYNQHGPTAIYSNDNRRIDIAYDSNGKIISATTNGRTWTYQYTGSVLNSVTRPDSKQWQFVNLSLFDHGMTPEGDSLICQTSPSVAPMLSGSATITNPLGAQLSLRFAPVRNGRVGYNAYVGIVNPAVPCWEYVSANYHFTGSLGLAEKAITVGGTPNIWTYQYQQDNGSQTATASNATKKRTVFDPLGSRREILVWRATYITPNTPAPPYVDAVYGLPVEGNIVAESLFATSSATSPIRSEVNTYALHWSIGGIARGYMGAFPGDNAAAQTSHTTLTKKKVTQDGDQFETLYSYDNDPASPTFSFGRPTTTTETSISTAPSLSRITNTVYEHNKTKWVLGLPKTVTINGKLFDSYTYDSSGRRVVHNRFGGLWRQYTYNSDGTIATSKDANNHTYTLSNWKRGLPQTVLRPDGLTSSRSIDNNGWTTSETDARGVTTSFSYNPVGWLTGIDAPSPFNDTTISYSGFGTASAAETRTRGAKKTTITYDGMRRPRLVKREATDGSAPTIYEKSDYDIFGRTTFASWPSATSSPSAGVATAYDALSRTISVAETVSPYATTTTEYLSGGRTRVIDPLNAQVTTTARGFGSPDAPEVMQVVDSLGATTTMTRDIYGNVVTLAQSGTQNGFTASVTRTFWYDGDLRLCRHRAPEFGDEVFVYDNEDRLIQSGRGATAASGCVSSVPTDIRVTRSYDALDRETSVTFPAGTPGLTRTYDGNGNILTANRSAGAAWTYTYDALNALTEERLSIDSITLFATYGYNANGDMASYRSPSSRVLSLTPNAFGQPARLRFDTASKTYAENIAYHANGEVASVDFDNGLGYLSQQNARQLTTSARTTNGSTNIVYFTYAHDANRRITAQNDLVTAGENRSYTYDANGRLLTATGPWGAGSFKYDALSNLREQKLGARTIAIAYDAAKNRVSSATDAGVARGYGYDARGNATLVGGQSFTYDHSNQPVAFTAPGAAGGSYAYDANLKRVKHTLNGRTVYSFYGRSGQLMFRFHPHDGTKNADYLRAGALSVLRINGSGSSYTETWLLGDHLGSAVAGANSTGAVLWRESYAPFGEKRLDPAANRDETGFTGHVDDDATGLTYMQARYYDPVIGRFLSTDPIGYQDQLNLYAYVHNDPVNATDPDGRQALYHDPQFQRDHLSPADQASFARGEAAAAAVLIGGASLAIPGPEDLIIAGAAAKFGGSLLKGDKAVDDIKTITIDSSKSPQAAQHLKDAGVVGQKLTVDRAGAAGRRADALNGTPTKPGLDRDEAPPAVFKEGGAGSSVRHIDASDNRSAGAQLGNQLRDVPDGGCVKIACN